MTQDARNTPAHARSGFGHWAVVAAGCAAVVGGALAAGPASGAISPPAPTAKAAPSAAAPDPAKAGLPLDCGPFPVAVSLKVSADLGDGKPGTVAAAHCDAGNGTPSDGVFVLAPGPDGRPVVAATLVEEDEDLTLTALAVRSDGSVHGTARGYSSPDVPRFAPDLMVELNWKRTGTGWTRTDTKSPAAKA
ncbi:hypothetical protein [Kitasatospora camelliae]|uniref:Secreted protein n=1 Tax=Kitasatospora camelliae TaxID=3156397 RepID=A0AAU8K2Z4_9ACTN